jgi:signal transduction histidine kinase/phage shock protein PspC (stress-responsive transcriptional regulator)
VNQRVTREEVTIDTVVGEGAAGGWSSPGVPPPPAPARLYRRREGRLLGGVAAGAAAHLGVPVLPVRVALVVLLGFNGLGALLYAVFWAILPTDPQSRQGERGRLVTLLPFAGLAVGVLIFRGLVGGSQPATAGFGWLVALIAIGAGIIWHQTGGWGRLRGEPVTGPPAPGTPWLGSVLTETGRHAYLLRFVAGGGLIVIGTVGLAAVYAPVGVGGVAAVINGLLFALLALAGVGLVAAPVLWRMFGVLREEREARIREQERAEFAAMVHDQVLHTLALIQRCAAAGSAAFRLARAQERTLRNWLYKPTGSPAEKLAAALEEAAGEVEDAYAVTVEVVVVGLDLALDTDGRVQALVSAAREALVNAARHAQVGTVSLYAEVEPEQVSVFVRDRGVGFDPATVEPSRHGVRGSIIGRMERHGGRAEIISTAGEGTEVRLTMPLTADVREKDRHE